MSDGIERYEEGYPGHDCETCGDRKRLLVEKPGDLMAALRTANPSRGSGGALGYYCPPGYEHQPCPDCAPGFPQGK